MPRTIRKDLIIDTEQAQHHIDALDAILFHMATIAGGRQPAIEQVTPGLLEAHDMIRAAWRQLRKQL